MTLPRYLYFVTLLPAALSLCGCGPQAADNTATSSSATTSNAAQPTTGAAGGSVVHFLSMDYDPVSSALQKQVVDKFNQQSKSGQVVIDVVSWDNGHQKLQTLISGNQAPDLAIVGTRWMAEYNQAGLLEDLGTAAQHGLDTKRFVPGVLETGRLGGKLVGLPVACSVRGLYYNNALLRKAAVAPPKSWAELEAAARKIKASSPLVAPFGMQGKEVETDLYFYYFLWGAGGDILKDGKCALDSPAGVEALNFELGLVKNGLTEAQPTGYNREDLQNLFKAGKLAMTVTGPWFAGMLKKDVPDLDFGVTYIPGKANPVVPAVADEIVMFHSAATKDLAWQFLKFWYSDANRVAWAKASGMLPELASVAKSPELTADKSRAFLMQALPRGRYVPNDPHWEQMATVVSDSVQQALLGKADAKTALSGACEKVNGLMSGG